VSKPVKFVHVGMPKCASSYIQSVIAHDPSFAPLSLQKVVELLRAAAIQNKTLPSAKGQISLAANTQLDPALTICASHEGLTGAFLNEPSNQSKLPSYFQAAAKFLGDQELSDNVLIIVRSPKSWIRSIHEQAIKQGSIQAAEQFVLSQHEFIVHSLNLQMIVGSWQGAVPNVRVLPLEMLQKDETAFWNRIADWFGTTVPDPKTLDEIKKIDRARNKSVGARLPYLIEMNRHAESLRENLLKANDRIARHVFEACRTSAFTLHGVYRVLTEVATDEEFSHITRNIDVNETETYRDFALTIETKSKLKETFIDYLFHSQIIDQEICENYSEEWDSVSVA